MLPGGGGGSAARAGHARSTILPLDSPQPPVFSLTCKVVWMPGRFRAGEPSCRASSPTVRSECGRAGGNQVAGAGFRQVQIEESCTREPLEKPKTTVGSITESTDISNWGTAQGEAPTGMYLDDRAALHAEDVSESDAAKG